jgi:hypothetical protein
VDGDPGALGQRQASTVAAGRVLGRTSVKLSYAAFPFDACRLNPQGALGIGDLNVEDWLRNKMLAAGLWGQSKQRRGRGGGYVGFLTLEKGENGDLHGGCLLSLWKPSAC